MCEQTWNILHKAYETTVLWVSAFSLVWKSSQFFHHKMSRAILGGLKPAWAAAAVAWNHVTGLHASWQGHCPGGFANLCVCTTTAHICWPDPCEAEMMLYPRRKPGKNKMGGGVDKNVARYSQMVLSYYWILKRATHQHCWESDKSWWK